MQRRLAPYVEASQITRIRPTDAKCEVSKASDGQQEKDSARSPAKSIENGTIGAEKLSKSEEQREI
jgi:hypothetical protein